VKRWNRDVTIRAPAGRHAPRPGPLRDKGLDTHLSFAEANNALDGVPGYSATPGWDAASGWGTPDVAKLLKDIAFMARGNPSEHTILARANSLGG
jgi:hypothetical protein